MLISNLVGIVADDFTGASDSALQFHLRGANAQIVLDPESYPEYVKNSQVWSISTASRYLDAQTAVERVKIVTERFIKNLNVDYYFKKIGSTLKGNIANETLAMLNTLQWDAAIIVPAFPTENKITVGGYQLHKGIPVERSEASRDSYTSIIESHVPTLLAKQLQDDKLIDYIGLRTVMKGAGPILMELNELIKKGKKLIVIDAISITDLEQIILATNKSSFKILPAGSTGFAQVLSKGWIPAMKNQHIHKTIHNLPKLIIAGSNNPASTSQIKYLEEHDEFDDNMYLINLELQNITKTPDEEIINRIVNNLQNKNIVLVNASKIYDEFDGFSEDSFNAEITKENLFMKIADFLAELTKQVLSKRDATLILLGDQTACKTCNAINSKQLQIIEEVCPAIALTVDHKLQWIVAKSGHVGTSSSLAEILKYIDSHNSSFEM